jgi:7-keto-8-aminopelargonate synthetase-like enzyme
MMTESDPLPPIGHASLDRVQQYRRRKDWALTPAERLERFVQLQSAAMAALQANPTALQSFIARNHRKRTQANARLLEQKMRCPAGDREHRKPTPDSMP